ncbi:CHAT domain-containing protein [Bradyrhizobium sp. i1.15.2]|uniref:CHAT domain-containing protein n=1 Tax=Bradyrhizobium sp. i1.15.2 TaxID=3156362 RepID=UPI0033917AC1
MNDIVKLRNDLSTKSNSGDANTAAQTAKDLTSLDESLSQLRDPAWKAFVASQRVHIRLALSKLYFNFGCRQEATALLEDSIALTSENTVLRAELLTNLGVFYTELDRLPDAASRLGQALRSVPTSVDYETAKTRLGILGASSRLARKRGNRQDALEFQRLATVEMEDSTVKAFFIARNALSEYEQILAVLLTNRAILLNYEQRPEDAAPLFDKAYRLLAGQPDAVTLGLPDLLIAWSDNRRDMHDPAGAKQHLDDAISLIKSKGGRPELLARAFQKRAEIAIAGGDLNNAIESIDEIERLPGLQSTPLERAGFAETKGALLSKVGRPKDAVGPYEHALAETRKGAPEGTLDVALAHINLSYAKRTIDDLDGALEEARAADLALTSWLNEEAAGCRAGMAVNKEIVAKIRESRGLFAIQKRKQLRENEPADRQQLNKIDRDVFDLVQERELDRVGVAAERGVLRRAGSGALSRYQQSLNELCAARSAFDEAVKSNRPDLAAVATRLQRAREVMAADEKSLRPDVRLKFATGTLRLGLEDLPNVLRDREAIIAFRVGSEFSLFFIAARHGVNTVTVSALTSTARQDAVEHAVTSVIAARDRGDFSGAIERLGGILRLGELKPVFEGLDHVFVVADGGLQRLPAHLLPIGSITLGDLAPTSALSSVSMLAALRDPSDKGAMLRSFAGFGAPLLDNTGCPKNTNDPRQLVQCLGVAFGATDLLQAAADMFGGSAPVTGMSATTEALRKADFSKTGILVLATHGLVGGDKISQLPAVVLTPDPANPADAGVFTTTDIANMNLDSVWLAVIAGCDTAKAAPDALEEGLSGLGLAFATAGAKALILSYWKAEPSATERLLERTLHLINDGAAQGKKMSLSAALAVAMEELRRNKYTPEQWAPFVVIGDGSIVLQ